jgi:hypothetical protein
MEVVMATSASMCVFNMDETSWHLINQEMSTIANIGADAVEWSFQGDSRKCLIAIASVDAAGGKIPCWSSGRARWNFARGAIATIPDCRSTSEVANWSFPPTQWMNERTCRQRLFHWLYSQIQRGPIVVLWDLFSAHREQGVKNRAQELGIELIFIPAEMTGEYQSLDRRIFENLKARTRAQFARHVMSADEELTMSASIGI